MLKIALILSLCVAAALGQESAPLSVADAARAARERQKAAGTKKVITNDDLPTAPPGAAADVSEAQVRIALQRRLGKIFYFDFASFVGTLDSRHAMAVKSPSTPTILAVLPVLFEQVPVDGLDLVRDQQTQFPGREQWDGDVKEAANNLHAELGSVLPELHAILEQNKLLLGQHDPSPADYKQIEEVRRQLVEALMPTGSWALRAAMLIQDGQSRITKFLDSGAAGGELAKTRERRVPEAERAIAMGLARLDWAEQNNKKAMGKYECNQASDTVRVFQEYVKFDYQVRVEGCTANAYQAFAEAPAPDGTQGHGFCVDQSGTVRIAKDGTSKDCLSSGKTWP